MKERLKKLSKPASNIKSQLAAQKHRSKEETIKAASKHGPRSLYLRDRKSDAEVRSLSERKPLNQLHISKLAIRPAIQQLTVLFLRLGSTEDLKKPKANLKPHLAAQKKQTKQETIKAAGKKH